MFEQLNALSAKVEELNKHLKEEGKKALDAAFQDFFTKYPEVEQLTFTAYTPWFNDGESCEYGVGELNAWGSGRPGGLTEDLPSVDSGDYPYEGHSVWFMKDDACEFDQDIKILDKALDSLEDVVKMTLGDHIRVTVTRKGMEIDEYEHD